MIFYLLIILMLVIAIFIGIVGDDGIMSGVCIFFLECIILGMIISIVKFNLMESGKQKTIIREKIPIVSLKTSKDISGSFLLGCGGLSSSESYYFMLDLGNHTYKRGNVYTSQIVIKETNTESPCFSKDIIFYSSVETKWWPNYLLRDSIREENYTLVVPVGTIIQKFEVQ